MHNSADLKFACDLMVGLIFTWSAQTNGNTALQYFPSCVNTLWAKYGAVTAGDY